MLVLPKYIRGAPFVAVASLFIGFFFGSFPGSALAAYVSLPYTFVSSSVGSSTIAVDFTPLVSQADGSLVGYKNPMSVNTYDLSGVSGRCYPGLSGLDNTLNPTQSIYTLSETRQQSITTGGYSDCSQSGTYYITFATYKPNNAYDCSSGKDCYYISYNWDSETETFSYAYQSGFNSETQTRFTDVSITGTSTVNIDATYWLEQSEITTSISEFNPTLISFEYALSPSTSFTAVSETISNTILDGSQSTETNLSSLADGTYDLLVRFSNFGVPFGAARPFPDSYVYPSFTIFGGVLSATSTPEFLA